MIRSFTRFLLLGIFAVCALHADAQVSAGFTVSDSADCVPVIVYCTNTSSGATSYYWDMGNGTTSTLANVSGSYITPGTYTITLVAHNGSSSSTYMKTIQVYPLPAVSFHATDTTLCPGISANFISTTVLGTPGPGTYTWNFGDGGSSSSTSPSHSYAYSGDYNVTLFATNSKGCINSLSKDPYIHVYSAASIGFSALSTYICKSPGIAYFSNTTFGTGPLTYAWRFGDGGTSPLASPSHHYGAAGIYDVSLSVTDGDGCKDSLVYPAYITVGGLSSAFLPVANACLNVPVTFTNVSTSHIGASWDYGDGGTDVTEDGVHTYTATGTYNVKLVVYDGTCYDTVVHPVTILHPVGTFTITPAKPCPPPVNLTFTASVPPGSTVTWSSRMAGPLGTGSTLVHNFPPVLVSGDSVGFIDTVTMILTDPHGCADTVGKRDTVNSLKPDILPSIADGCSPVVALFSPVLFSSVHDVFAYSPWYALGYPPPPYITYYYPYSGGTYTWNFGDGSPPVTFPSPSHTYTVVGGVYTVGYNVITSNGCTASVSEAKKVEVGAPPPMPTFTMTPTHICAGRDIYFTASASGVFDTYKWDYDDGRADTGRTPVHQYTVPGIFRVELKTSYNGCASPSYYLRDTVDSPSAVIFDTFNCTPRNKITFRDRSFGDDTHLWQFGDGTTSTLSDVIHTFPTTGDYPVTLTTFNAASGCRDTAQIVMKLEHLHGSFIDSPSVCRDKPDQFFASCPAVLGDSSIVVEYRWFFNGVFADSLLTEFPTDTVSYPFHTTGTNTAMLVLTDNHGCFDTITHSVLVAKPSANFSFTPTSGCAPLTVSFTDLSTPTSGTTLANYAWTFGDGATSTLTAPAASHTYTANATDTVKEIVFDNIGCSDTFKSPTHIVVHRPHAVFHASLTAVCPYRNITFINTSSSIASSLWFFGDGDTSAATSPTHAYSTPGTYSVTLVVTSAAGCTDTLTMPNYITIEPRPHAAFTMSDSFAVCHPFSVSFTNGSTGASYYLWTFGDGTASSAINPTDVYISPAFYTVRLIAFNSYACADTAIHHVNIFGYTGAFTYTPIAGCPPLDVHFTGSFTSVAHVVWDFADGVTSSPSSIDTISHIYLTPGAYRPKLILTDSFGCTAASLGSDTIKVGNLVAAFSAVPNPACVGNTVTFHDTSSGVGPSTTRLWTLASGVFSTSVAPTYTYTATGTYPVTLTVSGGTSCSSTLTQTVTVVSAPPPIHGNPVACIGLSTPFTDSVTGGVWSSGSPLVASVGSSTGIVLGVSAGVATISYAVGTGCTVTKTVTVIAAPAGITGASAVCPGSTIPMADATPSGVWSVTSTINAVIGSGSGIVSGVNSGPDTVVYTVGYCVVRKPITVNTAPAPISGSSHVCVGMTTPLTSSPPGGLWSSTLPSTASIGSLSGIVAGLASGVSGITYTLSDGCKATSSITVNPVPGAITGSPFVCIGGSTVLSNSITGGSWSSSNTSVDSVGASSGIVTGIAIGTSLISYNVGGCITSRTVSVNTFPPPITGPNQLCQYSSVTLSDVDTGGLWSSSSSGIASVGSSSGIVTAYLTGPVTIIYSLGGGCMVTTSMTVTPSPAGITGSPFICIGGTSALSDLTTGGIWSSTNTSVATIGTSGVVSGITGGADSIYYTMPNGCAAGLQASVVTVPPMTGLRNMCAFGDTLIVSDADTTGTYSSSLVSVTNLGGGMGQVLANAPGVASVTYVLGIGCSRTTVFTVNPLPGAISGTFNICAGSSVTLHDISSGGTWSTSGGVAIIGSSTGIVTGVSAGSGRVTYTTATGCKVDTALNVFVLPVIDTITGLSALCAGRTVTLADSTPGGTWSSASVHASVTGGTVSGVSSGTAVISYSITNPCGTVAATKTVTVYPAVSAGIITGSDTVCVGSSITLTDTVTGGVWTRSNTLATLSVTGVVGGIAPGVDTIIYTVYNPSCVAKTTHPVFINPQPDAGNISGRSSVCVGDTAILSDGAAGGLWSQSNAITVLTSAAGSEGAKAIAVGIDTIWYSVTNWCGTDKASLVLTISTVPLVDPILGLGNVCEGQNITLIDSVAGGTWSSGNTVVAVVGSATGMVVGVKVGYDTITYTVANACGSANTTKPVTVNALPVADSIYGPSVVCVGDSIALSDSSAGGIWSIANNDAAISGAVSVAGISAGTDMLSYSVTNICGTAYATRLITIDSAPSGIVIVRNCHVLSVRSGYASYQWMLNGSPIAGATTASYTFSGLGTYSVVIGSAAGCLFTTPALIVTDCSPADIQVYPNPASSVIYIQWCDAITARLTTIDGKMIEVIENASQVDVSYLPNAVYSLSLFDASGHKLLTKRITKLSK